MRRVALRSSLTVLVTSLLAVPALALPATAADAPAAPTAQPTGGGAVVVASLVRTDDGRIEVHRTGAASRERGKSLADRLRAAPEVIDAEIDSVVTASQVPAEDPLQPRQWGLPAIDASTAWAAGDATGQVVAIVDSGVDMTHPDLSSVLVPGHDYVRSDSVPDDENGHGTHVAGIAGAVAGNGEGGAGAGLRTKIMPIKVLNAEGTGSTANVAAAIRFAVENGADVVNLSLGGPTSSGLVSSAINDALAAGVPVVAAAGNQGSSTPSYPAAQPGVVAVGAVDRYSAAASFSNTGDHLAVVGPGVGILSTTPRTSASPSGYGAMSGTSMAAPFVTGVLAMLRAAAPDAGVDALRTALVSTANDMGPAGHDPQFGAGLVDAAAARAAVARVSQPAPAPAPAPEPAPAPAPEPAPAPSEPTADEPATGDTTREPTPEEPVAAEPVAVEPAPEQPAADQPSSYVPPAAPVEAAPTAGPAARGIEASCPSGSVPANPFTDVATGSTHERAISCLVWRKVANGKSAGSYAPSSAVTREEMAAFVARAVLVARPGSLPASPASAFSDDDGSVHRTAIDQLAAVGIVGGTGGSSYSPKAVVTRGQMARFLANAAQHVLGTPLATSGDLFTDDAGSIFETDINRVAQTGLTGGFSDGTYRASGTVTRDQMGSFLARTLDLFVVEGGATL